MPAKKSDNKETIGDIIADVRKKHDLRIGSLAAIGEDVKAITTGNIAIDHTYGVGGIPVGRLVELYGPPSSGKTTTALQAAVKEQQRIINEGTEEYILYLDYEQSIDREYCESLGLDLNHDSFLLTQPDSLEQGVHAARRLIDTGQVRICIWDSVAAMVPSAFFEEEVNKSLPALQARLMSQFLRMHVSEIKKNNCASIFLNHEKDAFDMGGRPGIKRTTTPGGVALKFYSSVRVQHQQIGNIKGTFRDDLLNMDTEQVEATSIRVRVTKNKVGAPFKQCIVRVRYGKGFDNFWSALQILISYGKLVNTAGYYYFERSPELIHDDMERQATGKNRPYIRTEPKIMRFADEHPEWRDTMIKAAEEVLTDANPAIGLVPDLPAESTEGIDPEDLDTDTLELEDDA